MNVLIFISLSLFALVHCATDNANTTSILIGTWNMGQTTVTSSSNCCIPNGTITIVDNHNVSLTLTSTSWGGSLCNGRSPDFKLTIAGLDGSDSWNQIAPSGILYIADSKGDTIAVVMGFLQGQAIMGLDVNGNVMCEVGWIKSTK